MANTLRFKRGLASGIPTAVAGEPLFTTDTFDLYIGNGTTNTRFQKYISSGTTSQYLRGDGSLATFPSLTGFVPYTGATANVDLGTHTIIAQNATIASSGSGNTATITHSSGSGIGLNITKGGNGEGLYINKTSGSGNAATIIGTLNATTLVKSGGTSTQYLMADGSTSTLTNPITGTGAAGQVAYFTGATTQGGSNNLTWDNTNNRFKINNQFLAGNEQTFNVYGSALFQQSIGDAQKIYIGNNTSLGTADGRLLITPNKIKLNDRLTTLTISADNLDLGGFIAMNGRDSDAGSTVLGAANIQTIKIFGATRNVAIQNGGTFNDSGQRLQVTGDTLLKGSGNTSATTALLVENSDGSDLLTILNNGYTRYGNAANNAFRVYPSSVAGAGDVDLSGQFLTLNSRSGATETGTAAGFVHINGVSASATSGIQNVLSIQKGFAPTSGTAAHNSLILNLTINQTGGANGITRGLYVNPTLTAAADWRSIEWSNNTGWGLYGAGGANNYMAGSLGIGETTLTGFNLRVNKNITGAATSVGISLTGNIQSDVTTARYSQSIISNSAASATTNAFGYFVGQGTISGTITNQYGFNVESTLTGATNNYGFYGNIASGTNRWNLYMNGTAQNYLNGELLIGSTTNTGEKLQVTGTAKITGASSFGGNMSLRLDQNAETKFTITNGTSGTSAQARIDLVTNVGTGRVFSMALNSPTTTAYKIFAANEAIIYSNNLSDIAILNDYASGNIKFAAGGSSTAHMTIKSNGRINMSSLPTSATGLSAGDLWNDGGTLKIA